MPTPGPLELIAVLVIALIVLGPGKLPDVGTALGKSIREFRRATTDIQDAVRFDTTPLAQAPVRFAAPAPAAVASPVAAPAQSLGAAAPAAAGAASSTAEPTH